MGRSGAFRAVVVVAALAAAATGCGDDGGRGGSGSTPVTTPPSTTTAAPQPGGSLTVGVFSEIKGADPILTRASGATGGDELGAIYDRLVQWNPVTKKYDPKTAESVTANATFTEWTIKVRAGIKFADGTAYDAAAVKFNVDRQRNESTISKGLLAIVHDVQVLDPLTVKIVLNEASSGFQYELSNSLGMIASPAVVQKQGKDFALNAAGAGAGPFDFVSLKPGEGLQLKRNPNYWGGGVYLDQLRFTFNADAGITYQGVKQGSLGAAHLREPVVVAQSHTDALGGIDTIFSMGELLLINNGLQVVCQKEAPAALCTGRADGLKVTTPTPGKDPKIRQAIANAIDIAVIDQRANDGKGIPAVNILDAAFPWNPKVATPKSNLDQAKRLVQEAKAAGWDGKIRLTCSNSKQRQNMALSIEAQLRVVGIDVDMTKANQDIPAVTADVTAKKDYDLACWGLPMSPDDGAQTSLESFLRSGSSSNRTGYANPAMDAALDELKRAGADEAKTAAYKKIAELFASDLPGVPISHVVERVAYNGKVHGLVGTSLAAVVYDKAWIEK